MNFIPLILKFIFWFLLLGLTVFESGHKKPEKRKKVKGGDAEEIDNFLGPWAKYVDEKSVAKPTEVLRSLQIYFEMHLNVVTAGRILITFSTSVIGGEKRVGWDHGQEAEEGQKWGGGSSRGEDCTSRCDCNPLTMWNVTHSSINCNLSLNIDCFSAHSQRHVRLPG